MRVGLEPALIASHLSRRTVFEFLFLVYLIFLSHPFGGVGGLLTPPPMSTVSRSTQLHCQNLTWTRDWRHDQFQTIKSQRTHQLNVIVGGLYLTISSTNSRGLGQPNVFTDQKLALWVSQVSTIIGFIVIKSFGFGSTVAQPTARL